MMRKSYIQLPSVKELETILATESKRSIPPLKEKEHFVSLEPLIEFLNFLGLDTSQITLDKSWQEVRKLSEIIINDSIEKIFSLDRSTITGPAIELYKYLSEEDVPEKSDFIFVFGAKTLSRLEKALELFKKGLACKLLFTGGTPLYSNAEPEANFYKKIAMERGVDERDIIVENKAISVMDNIRSSLNLLEKNNFGYEKIILVNSPYSQRRGFAGMMKYVPAGTVIYRVNSNTREGLRENDWFTKEEGIKYVLSEYYKIWFGLVLNTT